MVVFLFKWQTLIGSLLGGVFALGAALIVAFVVRRRDEIASAMMLIRDLRAFKCMYEALQALKKETEITDEDYPYWCSYKLLQSFHSLSQNFEVCSIRVMPINVELSAHLCLFEEMYKHICIKKDNLSKDFENLYKEGVVIRPQGHMRAEAQLVAQFLQSAVEHASCAERLISDLILSKYCTFKKIKHFFNFKNGEDKECSKILQAG
jgi:hypothetical protein